MTGKSKGAVMVRLGDIDAHVEPGSGASVNLMDEYQFKALSHRSKEINSLQSCLETLKTIQTNLRVKGEFRVTVRNKNRGVETCFTVIKGRMKSSPLLCRETLFKLGMLKMHVNRCRD